MSDNKRYFWLQLHEDFFSSKRIKKLRKLGADFVIIYLKLQLLSLQNNGMIEYSGLESSPAEELALEIDEDADKIQITLAYLQSCNLLKVNDETEFFLPYVEICTGSETASTRRSQKCRAKKTLHCNTEATLVQHTCSGEKEIEKELEIDKEKEIETELETEGDASHPTAPIDYNKIGEAYNSICVSFPRVKMMNDARRKAIKARLNVFSEADFITVFEKAEKSDFLKGKNERNWIANFDWMIKDSKFAKILEGCYDNREGKNDSISDWFTS